MLKDLILTVCPVCGGEIESVVEDWAGEFEGTQYIVPTLEYYLCLDCNERVYPRAAVQKIRAYSPAYQLEIVAQ